MEPTRHLKLEGAYNVRDLGGYPTVDGRTTRWRTFLRADSLHRLPPASQAALLDLGIRSVVDLRRKVEVEELPNVFAGSSEVAYINYSLAGDTPFVEPEEWQAESFDAMEPSDQISQSYSKLLDRRQAEFGQTLATLADPATPPAIYHCAGGKDRTGLISALLLAIAGVSQETIAEDYALTARYLWDRVVDDPLPFEDVASLKTWEGYQRLFCPPEVMPKTLQHLEAEYGGVEEYIRVVGLSPKQIEQLRAALVE